MDIRVNIKIVAGPDNLLERLDKIDLDKPIAFELGGVIVAGFLLNYEDKEAK